MDDITNTMNNSAVVNQVEDTDEYEDMTQELEEFSNSDNYWRAMTRIENKVEEGFLWFIGNRNHGNRSEALAYWRTVERAGYLLMSQGPH